MPDEADPAGERLDAELDADAMVEMYRRIMRCRVFDEQVTKLHRRGEIFGSVHTSIGQEGEIVGACMALRPDDLMVGNHRSHGHPIGKGAALDPLMAELLGKVTGVNRGKGGSMHLADFSVGSLGETSIVATGIPVAAGAALGCKMLGDDRVCLCFFGDGASNKGDFHEGLNLAAIWRLPVIYLCENNLYSAGTRTDTVCAVDDIAVRATAYGIPGVVVDGQDALAVYAATAEAARRARAGEGPTLIEAKTYRFESHSGGLEQLESRPADEVAEWRERDPVRIHRDRLVERGLFPPAAIEELEADVRAEVARSIEFARTSPYPELVELDDHLFASR